MKRSELIKTYLQGLAELKGVPTLKKLSQIGVPPLKPSLRGLIFVKEEKEIKEMWEAFILKVKSVCSINSKVSTSFITDDGTGKKLGLNFYYQKTAIVWAMFDEYQRCGCSLVFQKDRRSFANLQEKIVQNLIEIGFCKYFPRAY